MMAQERCITELLAQFVVQKRINANTGRNALIWVEVNWLWCLVQAANYYSLKGQESK